MHVAFWDDAAKTFYVASGRSQTANPSDNTTATSVFGDVYGFHASPLIFSVGTGGAGLGGGEQEKRLKTTALNSETLDSQSIPWGEQCETRKKQKWHNKGGGRS